MTLEKLLDKTAKLIQFSQYNRDPAFLRCYTRHMGVVKALGYNVELTDMVSVHSVWLYNDEEAAGVIIQYDRNNILPNL